MTRPDEFDFERATRGVKGWLAPAEGRALHRLARGVPSEQVIVEIGSWKGKSTICLAAGLPPGSRAKVYAVDPHRGELARSQPAVESQTFDEFLANLRRAGVSDRVAPVRDDSERAARNFCEPIGLVFIDGLHDFRSASRDYQSWFPKLACGGFIALHDSWRRFGPAWVSARALLFSPHARRPRLAGTITYFQKTSRNTPADRLENAAFVVYRSLCGAWGHLRLVLSGSGHA